MRSQRTFSRRSVIVGGGLSAAIVATGSWHPGFALAQSGPQRHLPDGMLSPAEKAPIYQTDVTHSTLQIPTTTLDESCTMHVYPRANRAIKAVSIVFRSEDLNASPSQFLVQNLEFKTVKLAQTDFRRMTQDAVDVLASMLIRQPIAAPTDTPDEPRRRFEYRDGNGYGYTLQTEQKDAHITVIRVGSDSEDFPWEFNDLVSKWADTVDFSDPASIEFERGWRVSYGPFDFHPSAYTAPDCFGP